MDIAITPSKLNGTVHSIASKSEAHRLLICAALAYGKTEVAINGSISKDIEATISCLESIGAQIKKDGGVYIVNPLAERNKDFTLDCGESGSTLRFLLPVAAALGENFYVSGQGRLPQRPLKPLIKAMRENGCVFSSDTLPFKVRGALRSGEYILPGDISSQFISGLLFAMPMLEGDSKIELTSPLESVGYVEMTVNALRKFEISVEREQNSFIIKGGQKYQSCKTVEVGGDWSNAAFWLTAGALSGEIIVTGLSASSAQGDRAICDILRSIGARVNVQDNCVTVSKGSLKAINLDASNVPDLVPVVAAALSTAQGNSVIYNISRLRLKESDRLKTVATALNSIGADIREKQNSLEIIGREALQGSVADSFNDHRIAMALAVASTVCRGRVIIKNAQAVEKSYPEFFTHFTQLGGKCDVITVGQ